MRDEVVPRKRTLVEVEVPRRQTLEAVAVRTFGVAAEEEPHKQKGVAEVLLQTPVEVAEVVHSSPRYALRRHMSFSLLGRQLGL